MSAGTIIYSALLTKFSVTGCYEVNPGVLRNKMSVRRCLMVLSRALRILIKKRFVNANLAE